jgi:hypothetical protein
MLPSGDTNLAYPSVAACMALIAVAGMAAVYAVVRHARTRRGFHKWGGLI